MSWIKSLFTKDLLKSYSSVDLNRLDERLINCLDRYDNMSTKICILNELLFFFRVQKKLHTTLESGLKNSDKNAKRVGWVIEEYNGDMHLVYYDDHGKEQNRTILTRKDVIEDISITLVAALKQIVERVEKAEPNCCSIKETINKIVSVLT